MTGLVNKNPPLRCPWMRDAWLDRGKAVPVVDLAGNAWREGGEKQSGRGTPRSPIAASARAGVITLSRV